MKKTELVDALATATGQTQAAAARSLDALLQIVTQELAAGQEVAITGFGSFKTGMREERTGRNPRTGESITIPAAKTVKFVAGAGLKSAIGGAAAE